MQTKVLRSYKINKLIDNELENICKRIKVSKTSFIEMALIEKMSKLRAYSVENYEINKVYDFTKNIVKRGIK